MNRAACLIFNPIAGQGDSEQDLATIKVCLEPEIALDIQFTSKEVDAGELALQAVANNAQVIIASGGDGTVSAVTEALIGKDVALGVISRGTANAFANAAPSTSVLAQGTAEVVFDDGLLDITILAPQTKTGANRYISSFIANCC